MSGQCLNSIRTVSGQYQDSVRTVSVQCPDSVWKVSGNYLKQTFLYTHFLPSSVYLDSVWTVCRQCVDSFWNVLDPPAGKVQTNLGNKSNYVKTVSGQCLNSIRTVSERCLESIWNRNFCTHIFCQAQSIWTVSGQCMDSVQTVCGHFLKGVGSTNRKQVREISQTTGCIKKSVRFLLYHENCCNLWTISQNHIPFFSLENWNPYANFEYRTISVQFQGVEISAKQNGVSEIVWCDKLIFNIFWSFTYFERQLKGK